MIQDEISEAEEIILWIDSRVNNLQLSSEPRTRMSGACFDLAHEHHKSIVLLMKNDLTGSALALLRPAFEAFIRGVWLHEKASDKEIDKFKTKDVLNKKFAALVKDIETIKEYRNNEKGMSLSEFTKIAWQGLNSYTHSGKMQIIGRNTPNSIESNYSDEEKIWAIRHTADMELFTLFGIVRLADNSELQREFSAKVEALIKAEGWVPAL